MRITPGQAADAGEAFLEGMEAFASAQMCGDHERRLCPYADGDDRRGEWINGFDMQRQVAVGIGLRSLVERL